MYGCHGTVSRMKTTIVLPDALLAEAKRAAAEEQTTLRALIEEGLREVLERRRRRPAFRLPDAAVDGDGLREEFRGADWAAIRDAAYGTPR